MSYVIILPMGIITKMYYLIDFLLIYWSKFCRIFLRKWNENWHWLIFWFYLTFKATYCLFLCKSIFISCVQNLQCKGMYKYSILTLSISLSFLPNLNPFFVVFIYVYWQGMLDILHYFLLTVCVLYFKMVSISSTQC